MMSENTGYVHKISEHHGDSQYTESVFPETRTFTLGSITASEPFTSGWAKKLHDTGGNLDEEEYFGVVMAAEQANLCWDSGKLGDDLTSDFEFNEVTSRNAIQTLIPFTYYEPYFYHISSATLTQSYLVVEDLYDYRNEDWCSTPTSIISSVPGSIVTGSACDIAYDSVERYLSFTPPQILDPTCDE